MKYNIWNKWDPLKVCMLGNNYAPEFFNGIPDSVGDPLKRICEETLEDLEGYKTVLQDFGVEVIQPEMDPLERFIENPSSYPRGPLQPRDAQLVLGNECYVTSLDHPAISKRLNEYSPVHDLASHVWMPESYYLHIAGADYPSYSNFLANKHDPAYFGDSVWEELLYYQYTNYVNSATVFMIGNRLSIGFEDRVGIETNRISDEQLHDLIPSTRDFKIHYEQMIGHTDANYHPIKPGAILSLYDVQAYEETFPGWDVCYLPDQSWNKVRDFCKLKEKNSGKWWLAGEEDNDEFTNFVETWLGDWVGYVEETVFDVNVLMLDEHHCCVSNPNNAQVNAFLKKHNIEPVYVPWRHRYFWDGGLHCITLDLYREGTQKDYFNR